MLNKFLEIFGSYRAPLWMAILNFLMLVGVLAFMLFFGGAKCLKEQALVTSCVQVLYPESPCSRPPGEIQKTIDSGITSAGVDCFTRAIQTCRGTDISSKNLSLWTTTTQATGLNTTDSSGGKAAR